MTLQERIKLIRKEKNVTQKQVAESIGTNERVIRNYEIGARKPDYDMLNALADYFDVPLDYLTGRGLFVHIDKIDKYWDEICQTLSIMLPKDLAALFTSDIVEKYTVVDRVQLLSIIIGDMEFSDDNPPYTGVFLRACLIGATISIIGFRCRNCCDEFSLGYF